jgi:hypothetical protein
MASGADAEDSRRLGEIAAELSATFDVGRSVS